MDDSGSVTLTVPTGDSRDKHTTPDIVAGLAHYEAIIERGLHTFVEVGTALLAIREQRLYREQYQTFEDYCRERWAFTRMRASQLIAAAETVATVNHGLQSPTNERQVRPLTRLAPDVQAAAWQEAVETVPKNGKMTAAHVEQVVEKRLGTLAPLMTSESPEWYTPTAILDRVVQVLGAIDLDPCSNSREHPNVPARTHYTEADDGLIQPWRGRIYMNPPYGAEISQWTEKLLRSYLSTAGVEAIALVPARTETNWFRPFYDYRICFLHGRLRFSDSPNSAPFPSAACYLGPDVERFADAFGDIGTVVRRVRKVE